MKVQKKTTGVTFLAMASVMAVTTAAKPANAALMTYEIKDIGTFTSYANPNITDTYSGTGFVGLYGSPNAPAFVHLFGLELSDYSRTALQTDITGLAGSTINSAFLSFNLVDGNAGPQQVTATSFDANGTLGYFYTPPSSIASQTYTSTTSNSWDVTDLLRQRVNTGENWFGLHLQGSTDYQYTYTDPNRGLGPDEANVRLVVDYAPAVAPVPELDTMTLMLIAFVGMIGMAWLRKKKEASVASGTSFPSMTA